MNRSISKPGTATRYRLAALLLAGLPLVVSNWNAVVGVQAVVGDHLAVEGDCPADPPDPGTTRLPELDAYNEWITAETPIPWAGRLLVDNHPEPTIVPAAGFGDLTRPVSDPSMVETGVLE